jgi:ferredoxin--NADP+ reductase
MNAAWVEAKIASRRDWADGLMTIALDQAIEPFEPGQWVNLALSISGEMVRRAYSIASAPGVPPEFYLSLVPSGALSPKLFELQPGDRIDVEKKAYGFFTLKWVPPAKELWMVATGTGLCPFLSILRSPEVWERHEKLVVVHGVREWAHLAYRDELAEMSRAHDGRLTWVPVVSREPDRALVVHGRITTAVENGELERTAGIPFSEERTHLMLCGNPAMIEEVSQLLLARGLRRHRPRNPGHFTAERYW